MKYPTLFWYVLAAWVILNVLLFIWEAYQKRVDADDGRRFLTWMVLSCVVMLSVETVLALLSL